MTSFFFLFKVSICNIFFEKSFPVSRLEWDFPVFSSNGLKFGFSHLILKSKRFLCMVWGVDFCIWWYLDWVLSHSLWRTHYFSITYYSPSWAQCPPFCSDLRVLYHFLIPVGLFQGCRSFSVCLMLQHSHTLWIVITW